MSVKLRQGVRVITTADLAETTTGEFLYCPTCGSEYSATRGDYFWKRTDEAFTCNTDHRSTFLRLVRRVTYLEEIL